MPYLTQLAAVARRTGHPVSEVSGWRTRGHGPQVDVQTIVCHHTAGAATGNYPSLGVVRDGRPGLDGPLAHYGIGRDGTIYVIAAGKCYHAGVVKVPSYANENAIGIEAENTGLGEPWTPALMASYRALCGELCQEFGLSVARVMGHKEVCAPVGRKDDPTFNMTTFRADVTAYLRGDDMPLTDADVQKIALEVWRYDQGGARDQAWAYLQRAATDDVAAIAAAVKRALPVSGAPTTAQLTTALQTVFAKLGSVK